VVDTRTFPMGKSNAIPALPPGFVLDDTPALPEGFVLEKPPGRIIEFRGRRIQVPDTATEADIQSILSSGPVKNPDGTYGEAPPGEIIHGATEDYISDQPQIRATRLSDTDERQNAVTGETLRARADAVAQGGDDFFPEWMRRLMPATQGFSFNSSDELISHIVAGMKNPDALANAMITMPEKSDPSRQRYELDADLAQEMQRQTLDRNRDERPIENVAGNVLGGLTSGVSLAKGGVTILGNIANRGLSNLIPRMAAGATEGGIMGSLAGYFGADGDNEVRTQEAVDNLPLSMGVGALAVPAVDLISAIMSPVVNTVRSFRDPEGVAEEQLARAMGRDTTTPEQVAARMQQMADDGLTEYRMVDAAGRNTQRLGAMAAKIPSGFRSEVVQDMAARQQGQGDRIAGYVDDALNAADNDAYGAQQALLAARRTNAQPLYDQAYQAPVPQGQVFEDMLQRQSVREAMVAARRTAAENQVPVTDLFTEIPNPNPTVRNVPSSIIGPDGNPIVRQETVNEMIEVPTARGWDFIKKELDARVNQLYAAGDTTAATAVRDTRNQLRQTLSDTIPAYREALAQYSDDSAALEAIDAGRQLIAARNPDEARALIDQANPANADLTRLGASREIGAKLDNMRSTQDKTQVFDTPNMAGKLNTLIDDPVARAIMDRRMEGEREMVRSSRTLLGGSSTVENLIDSDQMANNGGALAALLSGQPLRALGLTAGSVMGSIGQRMKGLSEDGANRIGEFLLSTEPTAVEGLAALYQRMLAQQTAPSSAPSIINATVNAPRGGGN
jgi:gas vesicle protein